jgi:ABC-type nickel/cobalt efflux system permease component RcnA
MNGFMLLCHALGHKVNRQESGTSVELSVLLITAASIGFLHTLFGPDHYLPFIMMSWARKWSGLRTVVITFLCGLGHIAGSIVLGLVGVVIGLAVGKLELFESGRGSIAAWLLVAFGLAYAIWGLRQAYKKVEHTHGHSHLINDDHEHSHSHEAGHSHVHDERRGRNITPWVLFAIFVFGPCEPLIPVLMYPAAKSSVAGLIAVTAVFAVSTIGTMLVVVMLARAGVNLLPLSKLNRYAHALSGAAILICGLAIVFLGL